MKNHVYKILEIVGSSQTGIEDAIVRPSNWPARRFGTWTGSKSLKPGPHQGRQDWSLSVTLKNRLYAGNAIAVDCGGSALN